MVIFHEVLQTYGKMRAREGAEGMTGELSNYVHTEMIKESRNYQWRVVSDSHKGAVEIYLAISTEVPTNQFVQDVNAQVNLPGEIIYEDVVCFYDQTNNKIISDNYLVAIPLNPAEGVETGYVDAFLKQLNITFSTAKSQLKNFLKNSEEKEFSLQWNEKNMRNTVETMKHTNNYSRNRLFFSTDDEESLVEQFKGEKYDGLERI